MHVHSVYPPPRDNGETWSFPWRHCSRKVSLFSDVWQVPRHLTTNNRGKKRRDTVLICLASEDGSVEEGKVQMNKVARNNMRVKLGDVVNGHLCLYIKYGMRTRILPFDDSTDGSSGNIFDVYLRSNLLEGLWF